MKVRNKRVTKHLSRMALEAAEGLFSSTVDLTLWLVAYLGTMSVPQSSVGQVYRAGRTADRFLHQVNYEVIKNALNTARKKGFIRHPHRRTWPEVTEAGKRRLATILPFYDEKRIWDKRMHLVTYDIPEKRRHDRELLREYLKRIGCGRLQDSVWLTPYNPIDILRSFIDENGLSGTIIISDMGKDGSIGEEDLKSLVSRVYFLNKLNDRYEEWLKDIDEHGVDHWAAVHYLSILRDDPQLPFDLLPSWWKGDRAYLAVKDCLVTK